MNELIILVVFTLDNQKYALRLSAVETIIRAVEFTALPKAPKIVNGIVNFHGKIIPVFNKKMIIRKEHISVFIFQEKTKKIFIFGRLKNMMKI
jgi:chemotaxis signal transduction protein